MKKILLISVLILAVSAGLYARKFVASGMTYSALGNYKVELADNMITVNGEALKTFVVSYANTGMEVTVAVQKTKTEKRYLVISDALSVQYVCHAGAYFGVEMLDKSYEKLGYRTSSSALNRSEYFHQKAITTGESCELDNTRLIAAFFPLLLNNYENIISDK
jgi:hypothetical protein